MSTIFVSKSEVVKQLNLLKREITELHEKQRESLNKYNKLMKDNFGFIEDGKQLDKLDVINLIESLITSDKIASLRK